MNTNEIAIRSIQHYMYCPHRWGLLEIDRAWEENFFVTRANLMHKRVHDPERSYISRGKRVFTSVPVYNDQKEYDLYGVTDCLELTKDPQGIAIDESCVRYKICIVEYKPTRPKKKDYHEEDLMQVFAQKLCVDHIFGGDCDAAIYYADVKKRIELPLREHLAEYDRRLKYMLGEMREYLGSGRIPKIKKGQKCGGCSMKDLCMPGVKKQKVFRKMIDEIRKMEV